MYKEFGKVIITPKVAIKRKPGLVRNIHNFDVYVVKGIEPTTPEIQDQSHYYLSKASKKVSKYNRGYDLYGHSLHHGYWLILASNVNIPNVPYIHMEFLRELEGKDWREKFNVIIQRKDNGSLQLTDGVRVKPTLLPLPFSIPFMQVWTKE